MENIIKVTSKNNNYNAVFSTNLVEDIQQMYGIDLVKYTKEQFDNVFEKLSLTNGTYVIEMKKEHSNSNFSLTINLKKH